MASFTYPGVYIEELSSGQHTITGVATSIGAFIGWASQGPVSEAVLVQSWSDYQSQFGGLDSRSWLGYAVNQFFANGGSQCYIVRLVWDGTISGGVNSPVACSTAIAAGAGYGTATITATSGVLSAAIPLGVGTPVLQSVTVLPVGVAVPPAGVSLQLPPLPMNTTLALTATGNNSDGSTPTLSGVTWTSSNPSILTVSPSGLVTAGTTAGSATITATSGIISGSISLSVTAASITSISVTPSSVTTVVGQTVQLAATANYSDGTAPNITSLAAWNASPAASVTFVSTPAVPLAPAQFDALLATAAPAPITAWSITNNVATFTAANSFSSGEMVILSGFPTSTFFNGVAVTVLASGLSGTSFEVNFTHANGSATEAGAASSGISAAFPSAFTLPASPTANGTTVSIAAADIVSIAIAPANATVPLPADLEGGEAEPATFTVSSTLSNSTPGPTPTVTWASSNPSVATVDANLGALTVVATGSTTISATYTPASGAPIVASTTLTVSPGHLTAITVTPNTLTLAAGLTQQLTVTGTFDDGSFVNMTGYAKWTSSNGYASVTQTGLVKGVTGSQSATIMAKWLGISSTAAVTITAAIPQSLAITTTPANTTSITPGQNLSLVATVTNSDTTTTVVTGSATWTSSAPSLISIAGPGVVAASATAGGALTLFANSPGIWANSLYLTIGVLPAPNNNRFNLLLQRKGATGQLTTLESYVNLSVSSSDPNYVVTVINNDSNYITFTNPATGLNVVPTAAPAATASPVGFSGGADGTVLVPTDQNFELALLSLSNNNAGVNLLDRVDIFNLLCIPGETDAATVSTLQKYCAAKRAFFIVDSPQLATIAGLMQSGPAGTPLGTGNITGEYASNSAYYFPWIQAPDPLVGNRPTLFPPCGFVAGIYAATDASRGVWKAPAGINAGFTGNTGLQYVLTDDENGTLNTQAVNCNRQFKVYGDVVWGARTLAGNDQAGSQWKYVPIRRLALFLESSLFDGTQWVVFEPNDETLWGQVRMNVGTFMQGLFLQGAFAGSTPQQAYFVKCDGENNPPASIALGVVNILVGFAPLYPAEFVVIEIQQIVAQAS
ncbi:MAG: Ig-like domain-containing protein [Terracidiphilus sp.]|jgi:phage tail sheath protein FI